MTPEQRATLYADGKCEICTEPKQHLEWLLCDHMNALLKTPTRSQPGMAPAMSR